MARLLFFLLLCTAAVAKDCLPFEQAVDHIGQTVCVTGKVLKVAQSYSGSMFLDFCENYRKCPFTVVVFRRDLKSVGDVRALEGQPVEITGKIEEYKDRAEIVLKSAVQLDGQSAKLPAFPKDYAADRHGNFSAGQISGARTTHPTHKKSSRPSDGEIDQE